MSPMKTPQEKCVGLSQTYGCDIYLKREDLHQYGSHKGRSIPHMIDYYVTQGITSFVISSSGNAGLASARHIAKHNKNNPEHTLTLTIYVGNQIHSDKYAHIMTACDHDPRITVAKVARPKQSAFQTGKNQNTIYLRQSADDTALVGYAELAHELTKIPNLHAIFVPTSSGTTAQALAQAFQNTNIHPQIHIVQTTKCHPLASTFDQDYSPSTSSIAQAIVDNIAHRKEKVIQAINTSHGSGWVINDNEITKAIDTVRESCELSISPNAALSIAGLTKAVEKGWKCEGSIVCLITGM